MSPAVAPFGSWRSPISAGLLATAGVRLGQVEWSGDDLYWVEGRPTEGGRQVVVCRSASGEIADAIPAGFNARSRVHEYGGGAWWVHGETVFFCNFDDQRVWRVDPGGDPRPVTPEPLMRAGLRYADGAVTAGGSVVVCVRETHGGGEVVNEVVAFPADGSTEPRVLATGRDFYSFPRPSPDGALLAWTCWDHPNMPWDGTELWAGRLTPDGVAGARLVAGGPAESVFQPSWGPDVVLHFVSDPNGWWNLFRLGPEGPLNVAPAEAELGWPQWVFGLSTYAFLGDGRIACVVTRGGAQRLALVSDSGLEDAGLPYTTIAPTLRSNGRRLALVGSTPGTAPALVAWEPGRDPEVVRRSLAVDVDPGYVSEPEAVEFPTEAGLTAHALLYRPRNPEFAGPPGERPPLIVVSHGGPTGATSAQLNLEVQFFTSRGFALADVNYGGSTGYGRAYRERLKGAWGVVDLADCTNAARFLAERGEVDGGRMAIRGGSAGGYTTLAALTFTDVFAAGASYFGVADLEALALDTHKFESRYLDSLLGPYPEGRDVYLARSPVHHADRLSCPVILFQGLEDEVVPPSQAEVMVEALRRKGIPFAYVAFEGEQHGFRKAENIRRCAEAELFFYSRVFGLTPADDLEPVAVENEEALT